MSQMTLEEFTDLTDRRFQRIVDGTPEKPDNLVEMLYTEQDSDDPVERGGMLTPLPNFQTFTGVGQIRYAAPSQGFDWNAQHVEKALGLQVQRRLWRFDRFNLIEQQWEKLRDAGYETQQVDAVLPLTEGEDVTTLINFTHTRGEAIFANSHTSPVSGVATTGTDNLIVTPLSKTALNVSRALARRFRDDQGRVRGLILDTLFVPPELEGLAHELTVSSYNPDTSSGSNSAMASNFNQGKWTVKVIDKMDDSNDYVMANMAAWKANFFWFWADRLFFQRVQDFETYSAKYSGYMQYTSAWSDWRVGIKATVT